MNVTQQVAAHYSPEDLLGRVSAALAAAGLGEGPLDPKVLAPLDQFHVRGLAATAELAAACAIGPGTTVLDIGSGLGGPSRTLAAAYGCRVTGLDLSPAFVDLATALAARTGLSDAVRYECGDALALPFADGTFDLAWTQHVAMNIGDRTGLYAEVHRVLRPGGRLAVYDVVEGAVTPLRFPVPWAAGPATSFLLTAPAMRAVLEAAGFAVLTWGDRTAEALAWFEAAPATSPSPLGLATIMGPGFEAASKTLRRNLIEGRAGLVQAIVQKA